MDIPKPVLTSLCRALARIQLAAAVAPTTAVASAAAAMPAADLFQQLRDAVFTPGGVTDDVTAGRVTSCVQRYLAAATYSRWSAMELAAALGGSGLSAAGQQVVVAFWEESRSTLLAAAADAVAATSSMPALAGVEWRVMTHTASEDGAQHDPTSVFRFSFAPAGVREGRVVTAAVDKAALLRTIAQLEALETAVSSAGTAV